MKKKYLIIPFVLGLFIPLTLASISRNKVESAPPISSYSSRIEKYRQQAIASLVEVDLTKYRDEQKEEILSLKEETINNINKSEDYAEIDSIVSSYNRYVLTIKTDEQLTIEEQEAHEAIGDIYYISSLDDLLEFRDDVNYGYSYKGDTVILTEDITIPSNVSFGDPIGNTDGKPFSGVFDGNNHTITGLTLSGHDSIALFSRVTGGTVKNLKMAEVDISLTSSGTQRSAAVVARANNAVVDNVHVLSGTISGITQTGGVVAFAMETVVIQNCSNAASVSSTGTSAGGILGTTHTDATSKMVRNCVNTGSITSTSDGIGGIVGGNSSKTTATFNVIDCINEGVVSGRNYVGGVIGIAREAIQAESGVTNCVNRGNVVASGKTGIGGVAGFARLNVTNCSIVYSVLIKGAAASTYPDIGCTVDGSVGSTSGKYGYISGGMGWGATQSGGKLINPDGSDYNS